MKTVLIMMMVASASVFAGYTYTYTTGMDFGDLTLDGSESILVDGGGGDYLNLFYYSTATINSTSHLISEGNGGIWQLIVADYSKATIKDGGIHRLDLGAYAIAQISGGWIDILSSTQNATYTKHIEIICRDWDYSTTTKILTGTWEDYSAFSIHLENASGYSTTYDNIKFTIIPEPATMLLIGLGVLFLRRKRS